MNLSRKTALAGVYRASDPLRARQDHVPDHGRERARRARRRRAHDQGRRRRLHDRDRDERDGHRRALRLPQPDAELRRFDLDRRLVVRRPHRACRGRDRGRTVRGRGGGIRLDRGLGSASRSAPAVEAVAAIRCDQYEVPFGPTTVGCLRDDRAAPHARIRHHVRAARRDRGHDAPARFDESGGQVSRSDHGRGRAGLAGHFLAAASARLLHHQRRRRRAGGDLGRARARPEEEAGLHARLRPRPCAIRRAGSATSSRSRRRNPGALAFERAGRDARTTSTWR